MLKYIIGLLLFIGLYCLIADAAGIPYIKTSRAVNNLAKRQQVTSGIDFYLKGITKWLAAHIRLNGQRRVYLEEDLRTARLEITPEEYTANAVVKALVFALIAIPFFLFSPVAGAAVLLTSFMRYRREMGTVQLLIQAKREAIENELARLVSFIEKTLRHNRDILYMLESYQRNAGQELRHELGITIADMKSGSYETAISRLEGRVGSTMMGDVCRGLIAVLRGDDNAVYWGALAVRFAEIQRQRLRLQAQKIPDKAKYLSMCLLGCIILIYAVVIVQVLIESIGVLF